MTEASYPNLFLVGAPKCGTTSLFDWFAQHEDVFCGYRKEPATLVGTREHPLPAAMPYDDYLEMYAARTNERYALDASTRYLAAPQAPANIAALADDPKIIMVLRSPVDAIYSMYFHYIVQEKESHDRFEDALRADDAAPTDAHAAREPYRETFTYVPQVTRYFETFGRENVRCILFDELKADDTAVLRDLCDWLDIRYPGTGLAQSNTARAVRFKTLNRLIVAPPKPAEYLASLILSKANRLRIRRALRDLNGRKRPNPPMNPETRRALDADFAPQIDALAALLGRDLSHWKGDGG